MLHRVISFAEQHAGLLIGLSLLSIVSAVVTMTFGVRIIARLPSDYFVSERRRKDPDLHLAWWIRVGLPVIKNLIGFIFVIAGIAMLVLPGQGILTLLAGLLLMNFPGKFAIERWLVRKRQVGNAVNWLRRRAGQPPLILDSDPS